MKISKSHEFLDFHDFPDFSLKSVFQKMMIFLRNVEKDTSRDQKGGPERWARAYFSPRGRKSAKFSSFSLKISIFIIFTKNLKSAKY